MSYESVQSLLIMAIPFWNRSNSFVDKMFLPLKNSQNVVWVRFLRDSEISASLNIPVKRLIRYIDSQEDPVGAFIEFGYWLRRQMWKRLKRLGVRFERPRCRQGWASMPLTGALDER